MSSDLEELDSAHILAFDEAKKLLETRPTHPLLKYFVMPNTELTNGQPDREKHRIIQEEMKDRFWNQPGTWREKSGPLVLTFALFNYYWALKKVNEGTPDGSGVLANTPTPCCPRCFHAFYNDAPAQNGLCAYCVAEEVKAEG